MTVQEGLAGSAWDFGPVFVALAKPYTDPTQKGIGYFEPHPQTPSSSLTRAPSGHTDNDETPKATPTDDSISTLGDLSNALLCLGYSVEIIAPTNHETTPHVTTETSSEDFGDKTCLKEQEVQSKDEDIEKDNRKDLEKAKFAAKQAEDGRRAVLQTYLSSSPDDKLGRIKQKISKQKIDNKSTYKDFTAVSKSLNVLSYSRKHVNMQLAAEKKVQLTLELHNRFPECQDSFYNPENIPGSVAATDPAGIHIFVDISNILIGFHDTLKRNRQMNRHARLPRQTLSFHNLSIILERGRPVAKRFLAGSDDIDCTQEARSLGYTTHILQRVDKLDLSLPSRSKKGNRSGLTSSDTDSGTPGRTRRAEQAVDEVLHLGMLQSLLDAEKPSTIVLASGDAAQAEFSDGFLKQVERALLKGWNVEVIAFRATTGSAYRDPSWISRWDGSFRLIALDDFAEMLHVPYE